jgi:ketosteroid isomerase-like protein
MSQESVEVVRRVMRRFVEQDIEGALGDIHSDAELDWSNSDAPDSGIYVGHSGWRAFMGARDEALGGRGFEFSRLIASGPNEVVLVGRVREQGRASGVEVVAQGAAVFSLRNRKVTRLKLYQTSDEALKAVGLAE